MHGRSPWIVAGAAAAATAAGAAAADLNREVTMDDRSNLARLVAPLNAEAGRLIDDEATVVERLPTPFLLRGLIFKVIHRAKHKPIGFAVGYAVPDNFTVLLAGDPKAFQAIAAKSGVRLDVPPLRISYAVTMLETTRRFDIGFGIIRDVKDLRLINAATPEEKTRFEALREKYRTVLKLPDGRGEPPWSLPIFAIVGPDLCRFDVTLHEEGRFELEKTVLEENVPFGPLP
jgi:hypothetical protein